MKVLLSAYSCAPNSGSEAGIGWNWAIKLADMGQEIWVLTRAIHKSSIEEETSKASFPKNLHFLYYDHKGWLTRLQKIPYDFYIYYYIWQWGAYCLARDIQACERFDVVHHITWGSIRQPSFMGKLGITFIFGPVAGGERAPLRLRFGYGTRQWIQDTVRDLSNVLVRVDPLLRRTFRQANKIYVTSSQTRELVPKRFWKKTHVQLAIATDCANQISIMPISLRGIEEKGGLRVLYVGRFLDWKGMHLGLPAFQKLLRLQPDARMTLVGGGSDEEHWRRLADKLKIADRLEWIPWIERSRLADLYTGHDVFLFPCLHDSGGMVVLEAMIHGLPVVCLDLGGPGVLVNESCGFVIKTGGLSRKAVEQSLADALARLAQDPELRGHLRYGAWNRARSFEWSALVKRIYERAAVELDEHPSLQNVGVKWVDRQ